MMAEKRVVSPWVKRNEAAVKGTKSQGMLYEAAGTMRTVLQQAKAYNLLKTDEVGNQVAQCVPSGTLTSKDGKKSSFKGQVSLPKAGNGNIAVWLCIGDEENFYLIDTNGVPFEQNTMQALDATYDNDALECVQYVLKHAVDSLHTDISQEEYWRDKRRATVKRRLMITSISLGIVALVGSGATWGIFAWGINPSREATAYAQAYDTQGHDLPGEGAPVTSYAFAEISPAEFDAIPKLRRKDTSLNSPRRVSVAYEDGCATVRIRDMQDGARLRVAMAENSSTFVANGYTLIVNDSSLDVCIANYKKPSSSSDMPKIAIQAVTDQE